MTGPLPLLVPLAGDGGLSGGAQRELLATEVPLPFRRQRGAEERGHLPRGWCTSTLQSLPGPKARSRDGPDVRAEGLVRGAHG